MKEILLFAVMFLCGVIGDGYAGVRDGNSGTRGKSSSTQRVTTVSMDEYLGRSAKNVQPRNKNVTNRATTGAGRTQGQKTVSRSATNDSRVAIRNTYGNVVARSGSVAVPETRTGAAYEQCKKAYFSCMDQFCALKNDDYKRCSCSKRVSDLSNLRDLLGHASQQITEFNSELDVVGMTAAQAKSLHTASDGENALTADMSASKALLQAIMNSIRGDDSSVGGKYSDLNSINMSFDMGGYFGYDDVGQAVAVYNGLELYNAVYPQCRNMVVNDCNDASLQRAITAYLMAVEQDCNTVQTALEKQRTQVKNAVRESSAMLDLARVENRQKHNSDDMTACLANVETAVLSEEVCGSQYHKCLDNGEFIDVTTGAPIVGVINFYELGNMLKFADGVQALNQKLSKVSNNKVFVSNFEKKVKKFANPALDKCTEIADEVWASYLDKALLDIYYAQQSKVAEIKQGCFDLISSCYENSDAAITAAMRELVAGDSDLLVVPDKIVLNQTMCSNYVDSCNNMFGDNIVRDYVENKTNTDTISACRAVAKQCFDKFGGTNYENFYYPYSGLFKQYSTSMVNPNQSNTEYNFGTAPDWFSLYEYTYNDELGGFSRTYKSECAKTLAQIDSCSSSEIMEEVFGGFDAVALYNHVTSFNNLSEDSEGTRVIVYGLLGSDANNSSVNFNDFTHRKTRPSGVATEIYNQIIDNLTTQCVNLGGRFVETQYLDYNTYKNKNNRCIMTDKPSTLGGLYGFVNDENMCPRDYNYNVDTTSWGACLCWENGGRRSKNGVSPKCIAGLPVSGANDASCDTATSLMTGTPTISDWCIQTNDHISGKNQVCPLGIGVDSDGKYCDDPNLGEGSSLPEGLKQ